MLAKKAKISLIFIYGTIAIFGTFSNTVSIFCLLKQWKVKPRVSNAQKILMSLIISDLLISTVSCPIQVANFFMRIPTHGYVVTTLCGVSSLTILLLALDKFLRLTRFSIYPNLVNDVRLTVAISFCWIFPTIFMTSAWWNTVVFGLINGLLTLITLLALPVLYVRIYRFYMQSKRNVAKFSQGQNRSTETENDCRVFAQPPTTTPPKDESTDQHISAVHIVKATKSNQKNRRRLTTKILVLMSTYFICTIIYSTIAFLASFRLIDHSTVFYLSLAVYHANSMMNPIIYVFRDSKFRRTVKQMFGIRSSAIFNPVKIKNIEQEIN